VHGKNNLAPEGQAIGFELDPTTGFRCTLFTECLWGQEPISNLMPTVRPARLTYIYTVENRLKAIYDADELLVAMAYDGDGNRIFQLNYNLHTDDDWKGNSGNGNNKDNSGSGNSGNTSGETGTGSSSESDTTTNTSTGTANDNNGTATGNTNNTDGSQNQSGILFPIAGEVSELESELIGMIKTTGREKNYDLIEYVNDVNREHTEVLHDIMTQIRQIFLLKIVVWAKPTIH